MKRISISEIDTTSISSSTSDSNVVYVPGFAWTGKNGTGTVHADARDPKLCSSLSEFEYYFGTSAPEFATDQAYPEITANTGGFSVNALPASTAWFSKGDTDPAYIYAKELIGQGIPVLYERLNYQENYPTNITTWTAQSYNKNTVVYNATKNKYYLCVVASSSATEFKAQEDDSSNFDWVRYKGYAAYQEGIAYSEGTILCCCDAGVPLTGVAKGEYVKVKTASAAVVSYTKVPTYAAGDFAVGAIVYHNNLPFRCKQAHTGGATWTETNWDVSCEVSGSSEFDSQNHYSVGDICKLTLNTTNIAEFSSTSTYKVGELCYHTASSTTTYYRCKTAVTTAGAWSTVSANFEALTDITYITYICKRGNTETTAFSVDNWEPYLNAAVLTGATSPIDNSYYIRLKDYSGEGVPATDEYSQCSITYSPEYIKAGTASDFEDEPIYDVTIADFYNQIIEGENLATNTYAVFDTSNTTLLDKSLYSIKYITTGGYPNFEYQARSSTRGNINLASAMAQVAYTRGDCVAFIDHTDKPERLFVGDTSVYAEMNAGSYALDNTFASFATMITPWASYKATTMTNTGLLMPGSFGYLSALAASIKYYSPWLAIAGGVRGVISNLINLHVNGTLTNTIADNFQSDPQEVYSTTSSVSINAITYINPYGYCVFGNRTALLLNPDTAGFAGHFLNLRNLMSDIKKAAYKTAQACLFEQNNERLWLKFKSGVSTTLDEMKAAQCIRAYQFVQTTASSATKVAATIKVWPVYAVEAFDINIALTDEAVDVE